MLTPHDAGTILSDLGALKTQSVEESSHNFRSLGEQR